MTTKYFWYYHLYQYVSDFDDFCAIQNFILCASKHQNPIHIDDVEGIKLNPSSFYGFVIWRVYDSLKKDVKIFVIVKILISRYQRNAVLPNAEATECQLILLLPPTVSTRNDTTIIKFPCILIYMQHQKYHNEPSRDMNFKPKNDLNLTKNYRILKIWTGNLCKILCFFDWNQ